MKKLLWKDEIMKNLCLHQMEKGGNFPPKIVRNVGFALTMCLRWVWRKNFVKSQFFPIFWNWFHVKSKWWKMIGFPRCQHTVWNLQKFLREIKFGKFRSHKNLHFDHFSSSELLKWEFLTFWYQPNWFHVKIRVARKLLNFYRVQC